MSNPPVTANPEEIVDKSTYTPAGVLCFADGLFKPKAPSPNAAPRYSCILLFDDRATKTRAYQNLRAICAKAIADKWGAAKAADATFVRSLRLPFRNAKEKSYAGFENGEIFVSPWSDADKPRPGIVDMAGDDMVQSDVYSGQMARAYVRAFAFDNTGNKGVGFIIEGLQVVKADMPRLDGRRSAHDAFKNAPTDELAAMGINLPDAKAASAVGISDDMPF